MHQLYNPFDQYTGSDRLGTPRFLLLLVGLILLSGWITSLIGMAAGFGFLVLPFIFVYLYLLFKQPILGLYTAIVFGFILLGIGRYLRGVQVGLAMDGILYLTFIALIFNRFHEKVDWSAAKKDITLLSAIWFAYSIFEIVNPEARSFEAWFSGRGVGLYMMMMVPLTLLFIDTNKKLDTFFLIWGIMSLLVTLKGLMQLTYGVDPFEKMWLDDGNAKTHILFGKLRIFSFLSDAGQFGANQAYSAVVATIVAIAQKNRKAKLFYAVVAVLAFYGMVISGTRGALSIPMAGFMAYFVLRKNVKIMIAGFLLLIAIFVFFKYTTIGQDNQQIRRMRTAFDPNDASLQVRINNQIILKNYLSTRPFGGGIGHGGVKAQRYLPNAFLSQIATDSWYVLIWVEQGIVGLMLHLFILFYVVSKASFMIVFRIRDPELKLKMSALTAGMFGVMVASYGNAVLGQMPTSMLIYTSMALMLNSEQFDVPVQIKLADQVAIDAET
jgi:hypothetical protein